MNAAHVFEFLSVVTWPLTSGRTMAGLRRVFQLGFHSLYLQLMHFFPGFPGDDERPQAPSVRTKISKLRSGESAVRSNSAGTEKVNTLSGTNCHSHQHVSQHGHAAFIFTF